MAFPTSWCIIEMAFTRSANSVSLISSFFHRIWDDTTNEIEIVSVFSLMMSIVILCFVRSAIMVMPFSHAARFKCVTFETDHLFSHKTDDFFSRRVSRIIATNPPPRLFARCYRITRWNKAFVTATADKIYSHLPSQLFSYASAMQQY